MGNRESENYLDNLLDSITDMGSGNRKPARETVDLPDEVQEEELFPSDDDFLRAFEEELEADSYKDYLADFERDLELDKASELELHTDKAKIPDDIGAILKGIEDDTAGATAIPGMPEPSISSPEEILLDEGITRIERRADERASGAYETPEELPLVDALNAEELGLPEVGEIPERGDEEISLAGNGDDDLMDLLAQSGELDDIGEILNGSAEVDSLDEIDHFAREQMEQQAGAMEADEPGGDDDGGGRGKRRKLIKRKREKKAKEPAEGKEGSFIERMKKMMFGEDEPEEEPEEEPAKGGKRRSTSDENEDILKELDEEEKAQEKKAKKEKAKKEKKPKKEKPKKEPKPKKPPKPKKEKKPKEKDPTPPLPKKPVIMIVIMVASLAFLVMLGTNLLNYSAAVTRAKEAYSNEDYTKAYALLQGEKIKDKDKALYNKLSALAAVSSEYDAFLIFRDYGAQDIAMDSLVCAAGRYDLNLKTAEEFECLEEFEILRKKIEDALTEQYRMTLDEAVDMYNQRNRTEYTILLRRKLRALGLE